MVLINQELETYLKEVFSDRKVYGEFLPYSRHKKRFIYVTSCLVHDDDLHYEYYQGYVELHIEGKYQSADYDKFVDELRSQTCHNSNLKWLRWQGKNQCRCRIDYKIESREDLKDAFLQLMRIFDPIIYTKSDALKSKSNTQFINKQKMQKQSKDIQASIVSVGELMNIKELRIPIYQRPYRWTEQNVRQLLEDVQSSMNAGKRNYRIGSVILHNNTEDGKLDIVDGQQRLTTLYLLWNVCGISDGYFCPLTFGSESYESIKQNHTFIKEWLEENIGKDKENYLKYVFDACDFVKIVVDDLTEAFQMFDSQNGRGKELEAYNLLKAYHIRAMELESREEKIRCDKRWEEATQYDPTPKIKDDPNSDVLKQLFDEQLYRSRIWSRQTKAEEFSKTEIEEFKGFTIDKNHPALYPYQNPQLLQYLTAKFYDIILSGTAATKNRFEYGDNDHINPFVNINQQIVNGKNFFDYVETYVEIYKQMFINIGTYQLSEFKEFYYTHCLNYNWNGKPYSEIKEKRKTDGAFNPSWPAARTGDSYLREAYKSLVFVLFDKFGEKGLNRYYKSLYRLIYSKRLQKSQVKYKYVADLPCELFKIIVNAKDLADLAEIDKNAAKLSQENYGATDKISNTIIVNLIIGKNNGN